MLRGCGSGWSETARFIRRNPRRDSELIRRRPLDPIDDESVPLRFRRLELQPELLLDRGEQRGSGVRQRID